MAFWDVIKEVSAQSVRQEANRLFLLGLAGNEEDVAQSCAMVLGPNVTTEVAREAAPFLYCASPPYTQADENRLRHADLLVSLPGGPGITDFRPADTLQVDRVEDLPNMVLARRPDLRVAMARRLPGFRPYAAEQVIREVSRVNAEFAAISGISSAIPLLAPFFPAVVGADVLVLTKNQVLMVFRLAAIYGEDVNLKARAKEVLAVIGSAFGWRTLARQAAGAVPGAVGLPLRTGVAFSATYAVGRAAQMVFDEGRRPTRQEMLRIYEDAAYLARGVVDSVKSRFRKKAPKEEPTRALPAPERETAELAEDGE